MSELLERLRRGLLGRYAVERELGRGGMATVFLARDERHARSVAVKVLRPELASSLGPERFIREIRVAAGLTHPNILPLLDSGEVDGLLYYVMPYVEGESLADRLARESQLPIPEGVRIARQVAGALGYAHDQGVVHRDIKPDNILLSGGQAVVADFGIARALGEAGGDRLTETGLAVGTPAYMSPEQASGSTTLDGRSDIYSLGCVLYEMLIGEPPFTGPSAMAVIARHSVERVPGLRPVRGTIPESIEEIVLTTLEKTPADRYANARELVEALERAEAGQYVTGSRAFPQSRPARRARVGFGAILLVLGAGAIGVLSLRGRGALPVRTLDPAAVAIMPFSVARTADGAVRQAADELVELLYQRLPGDGGPRAVFPGDVRAALAQVDTGEQASQESFIEAARTLGAGLLVLGQVFGDPGGLSVTASILEVGSGRPLARVESVSGPSGSLITLADVLAVELLARTVGESDDRIDVLRQASLPAARAYVAGQAAFSVGLYDTASERFAAALREDSTLALAGLGMAAAGLFQRTGNDRGRGQEIAWARRDRLPRDDRLFLTAMVGPRYPAESPAIEEIGAWEAAVAANPTHKEAWYQLGEALFHSGPWLGLPGVLDRAAAAFRRAIALDSAFVPALGKLLDVSAARADTATFRELLPRYLALDSVGDLADYYRWRGAILDADTKTIAVFRRGFDHQGMKALERIISFAQLDGVGMEDAVLAAEALRRNSGLGTEVRWAYTKLREIALNRGRPAEADTIARLRNQAVPIRPRDRLAEVIEALFWDADTTLAAEYVREMAPRADAPPVGLRSRHAPAFFDICAVNLWRATRGEFRGVAEAAALLGSVTDASVNSQTGYITVCALTLATLAAFDRGDPDAGTYLMRLDSLARAGPVSTSWAVVAANLTAARLFEQEGDIPRALAAVRRRTYGYDTGRSRMLVALSTQLREEGRLAALAGQHEEAIVAYRHFLALRTEPEPRLAGEVAEARRALDRLLQQAGAVDR